MADRLHHVETIDKQTGILTRSPTMALDNYIPPGGLRNMAGTSERVRTAGEIAAQEVIASIVYPGHAEKSRQNPRWWDTPASRYDPESGETNPDDAVPDDAVESGEPD